jgi:hypothetical protein
VGAEEKNGVAKPSSRGSAVQLQSRSLFPVVCNKKGTLMRLLRGADKEDRAAAWLAGDNTVFDLWRDKIVAAQNK